jgi:hypothetical protein
MKKELKRKMRTVTMESRFGWTPGYVERDHTIGEAAE